MVSLKNPINILCDKMNKDIILGYSVISGNVNDGVESVKYEEITYNTADIKSAQVVICGNEMVVDISIRTTEDKHDFGRFDIFHPRWKEVVKNLVNGGVPTITMEVNEATYYFAPKEGEEDSYYTAYNIKQYNGWDKKFGL